MLAGRPYLKRVPRSALVVLGGGLDSVALLMWLKKQMREVRAIHFQYGQKASREEIVACSYFCSKYLVPLHIVEFDMRQLGTSAIMDPSPTGVRPKSCINKLEGRNAVFVAMAATYAATMNCDAVCVGFHQEPTVNAPFPDATWFALHSLNEMVAECYTDNISVLAPFGNMTRTEIAKLGHELDQEAFFKRTHTCYENVPGGCGVCKHCKQREVIIENILRGEDAPLPRNE